METQNGHNVPFLDSASLKKRKRNVMKRIKQFYEISKKGNKKNHFICSVFYYSLMPISQTHMQANTLTFIHESTYMYIHIQAHACTNTHTYIIHIHTYTYTHTLTDIYTHIHIHAHTHTFTYIHSHIVHISVYTCKIPYIHI